MIRIKQVARLLGYGDPQVLEVFKNTVPNRLYWVLFAIDNLHDAVETTKRFLTKEKIDRQMTGQNSTPFMRMAEKKRKSVSFVLEKTNENMEKMTALMDKMYIKLEQKDVPYKPQIYQRGRGQSRRWFDGRNSWRGYRPYSRIRNDGNRGYGHNRGNSRRDNLGEDITTGVDIIGIEKWRGFGKTGEYGDNLDQEKEVEEARVNHHLVLGRGREQIQTEIGLDALDVESMITLLMNVLIKLQMIQIRRVIVQDRCRCIWQTVIQGWM